LRDIKDIYKPSSYLLGASILVDRLPLSKISVYLTQLLQTNPNLLSCQRTVLNVESPERSQ